MASAPRPAAVGGPRRRGWNNARAACEAGLVERRQGICASCGQQHWLCSGHVRLFDNGDFHTGKVIGIRPCVKWPMHGQSVCPTHGGKGRNRVAGERQWQKERKMGAEMERAERAVKTFGLPITISPQQALLDEIARTAGHVEWLGGMIGDLSVEDAIWGRIVEEHTEGTGEMATAESQAIDLTKTVKGARPAIWVELYQKERAHLVHVAKVAIQCGLAERQVKLAEEQGHMIANVLRQVLEAPELELTVVQVTTARAMASKVLRSMSGPPRLAAGNGH